jgi:hypothetical protein
MAKQNRNPYKIRQTTAPQRDTTSRRMMRNLIRWRSRHPEHTDGGFQEPRREVEDVA